MENEDIICTAVEIGPVIEQNVLEMLPYFFCLQILDDLDSQVFILFR